MLKKFILLLVFMFLCIGHASSTELFYWGLNVNGSIYEAPGDYSGPEIGQLPGYVDDSGFDWVSGLGDIEIDYNPGLTDDYSITSFFDHEIVDAYSYYNDNSGSSVGSPDAGLSWEIDEPGYLNGDIYDNFLMGTLDNSNNTLPLDDVSMAMGWNFTLEAEQSALVHFIFSDSLDDVSDSAFYLTLSDMFGDSSLYFTSTLEVIDNVSPSPVPEPSTSILLIIGLCMVTASNRRFNKK